MEDVLEVDTQPSDPERPQVCIDETNKLFLSEARNPLPAQPDQAQRVDYEYQREGLAGLFMFCEPLVGKRFVQVTDQRTRKDWAHAMKPLADEIYPQAERIVIVMDNLSAHSPVSFYHTFESEEALRLSNRFEFHYTPKHGSWLNIAEIALGVLTRQCLNRRISDKATLERG